MKIHLPMGLRTDVHGWLTVSIIAATAIGIVLRVLQYVHRGGLWLDEALLANSIVTRSSRALIFSPLEYNQLAPPGFLQAAKVSTLIFGPSEFALRLPSFALSLACLAMFALLATRVLRRGEALFAVIVFAVSPILLTYAAEVKQYAGDATAAAGIALLAIKARESGYATRWIVASCIAGLSVVWISDTSMIVLAGTGIGMGLLAWIEHDKAGLKATAILAPVGLIAAGASLAGAARRMAGGTGGMMHGFWGTGFMPLHWQSAHDAIWLWPRFINLYSFVVGVQPLYGASLVLGLFGVRSLWKRGRRDVVLIVMMPVVAALIVSAARLYPLSPGRLTIYLGTALTIALAAGAGDLARRLQTAAPFAMAGLLLVFLSVPEFVRTGTPPPGRAEDLKPVLSHIRDHYLPGDKIYVYWAAAPASQFYRHQYGMDSAAWIPGGMKGDNWQAYVPELDKLRGSSRVWVIFAHTAFRGSSEGMIKYLDTIGRRRSEDSYPASTPEADATVILYDFSNSDSSAAR